MTYKTYEVRVLRRSGGWFIHPVLVVTEGELARWVALELLKMEVAEVWTREKRGGRDWEIWRSLHQ